MWLALNKVPEVCKPWSAIAEPPVKLGETAFVVDRVTPSKVHFAIAVNTICVWFTSVAALYKLLPACETVIVVDPGPTTVTTLPLTVATAAFELV